MGIVRKTSQQHYETFMTRASRLCHVTIIRNEIIDHLSRPKIHPERRAARIIINELRER